MTDTPQRVTGKSPDSVTHFPQKSFKIHTEVGKLTESKVGKYDDEQIEGSVVRRYAQFTQVADSRTL